MSSTTLLNVQAREALGTSAVKKLRRAGNVPAIAYGLGEDPTLLQLDAHELRTTLTKQGSHGLFTLKYADGSAKDIAVIIKDLQLDPIRHEVRSVDFLRVSMSEKITTSVGIILEGEPVGVRVDGGVLAQALHEIQISALPKDLPEQIVVDVNNLELGGAPLFAQEIQLPEGVELITDGEAVVASITAPRIEAESTSEEEAAEGEAAADGESEEKADSE